MTLFRICSGQNRKPGGNSWGVCLTDFDSCPWWRAEDRAGRMRTFATPEAAQRLADKLEGIAAVVPLADLAPKAPLRDVDRVAFESLINEVLS